MEHYFGIDVGGTNAKFGIVSRKGELLEKIKYPTPSLVKDGSFVKGFSEAIKEQLKRYPGVQRVGIGIPGLISKDRKTAAKVQNIPSLSGENVIDTLKHDHPKISFRLENDANVAALGEHYFSTQSLPESFIMVTLGTGVGGAAIVDGKIFTGADGNGLEIGHILSTKGGTIESHIGKKGILAYTQELVTSGEYETSLNGDFDAKAIAKAAKKGDFVGEKVFKRVGKILGECLVSSIRILDIKTVVIGGGVSDTFPIIEGPMMKTIHQYLPDYYTDPLKITKATLANEAGIIGAASLCF